MQRDRAWRRSQRERKIQNVYDWVHARNWFARLSNADKPFEDYSRDQFEYARRRASAPQTCSRWCCGNPRQNGTTTLAEYRFDIRCEEEYQENDIRRNFNIGSKRW